MSDQTQRKQTRADWRHVRDAVKEVQTLALVHRVDVDDTSVRVDTAVLARLLESAKARGDIR